MDEVEHDLIAHLEYSRPGTGHAPSHRLVVAPPIKKRHAAAFALVGLLQVFRGFRLRGSTASAGIAP